MSRIARDITDLQRASVLLERRDDPRARRNAVEALTRLRHALGDDVTQTIGYAIAASLKGEALVERISPDRSST